MPLTPSQKSPSTPAVHAKAVLALMAALLALAALAGHATLGSRTPHLGRAGQARGDADARLALASLAAPTASRTWDLAFWSTQETACTPLWRQALAYCLARRESAFPACTAVHLASWWRPVGAAAGRP